jgi:hypothetical protein
MNLPSHWMSKLRLTALICPLLIVTSAPAANVYYSGELDIAIPTDFEGVYLNITTDGYSVSYTEPGSWDVNFFFGGIFIVYSDTFQPFVDTIVSSNSQILNVAEGTMIQDEAAARTLGIEASSFGGSGTSNESSGSSHFNPPTIDDPAYSAFTPGEQGYIAFVLNPGPGQLYGWMRVTLTNNGTPGTIHDWALSSDENFTVGMIPEPSIALLGGMLLLLLLRRRR